MFEYREIDDLGAVAELAAAAFSVRQAEQSGLPTMLTQAVEQGQKLYGITEDGRLLAVHLLLDFHMRLRNAVVPMGGIGLLCSRLDVRGKGAVRTMLRESLARMRDAGHVISVLDPFDQAFYRKYGWELFERYLRMEITPGRICVPEDAERLDAVDLPFPDEASRAFYNEYAAGHYTLVQRGEAEWTRRTRILPWSADTAARGVVRVARDGRIVGLIGYDLMRDKGAELATFVVNLFIHQDEAAKRAMLRYLSCLSHQVKTVRFAAPIDFDLWPYYVGPPDKREICDLFMIRIVSLEGLDGLSIAAEDGELVVDVLDEQAPWNGGVWRIGVVDGRLTVARDEARSPQLRCGIGSLSTILAGFTTIREMIRAGRVEALPAYDGYDLPREVTFLADYF